MDAYPAYALRGRLCLSTQLVVTETETQGNITTIHLKGPVYALRVNLKYKTYADVDMIEAWTEVSHQEKAPVTLTTFDSSSLGDWVADKQKLPEGIGGLLRDARKHGVKFGIWLEPEMTNTVSELYEKKVTILQIQRI